MRRTKREEALIRSKKRSGGTRNEFLRGAVLAAGTVVVAGISPTLALAGQSAQPKMGAQLIGMLEGPELVLDPARWPRKFGWKVMVDEGYGIGTVGQFPAAMGVRIVSKRLENIASWQVNAQHARTPCSPHPATFFFKS